MPTTSETQPPAASVPQAPGLLARARYAVALAWRADRAAVLWDTALSLLAGVLPAATAWLIKAIIDALATGGPRRHDDLPWLVAGLVAAGVTLPVVSYATRYVQNQLNRAVALAVQDELYAAVGRFQGLRHFEQPQSFDELRLAQQMGAGAPEQLVASGFGMLEGVLSLLSFTAALAYINVALAAVALVAAIPIVLLELSSSRRRADLLWDLTPAARRQMFYGSLLVDLHAAKEIRLFGLAEFLRRRMLDELRSINAAERRLDAAVIGRQVVLAILSAVAAGGGLIWVVLSASRGRLTVGDVSVFIAGAAGLQGALTGVVSQLGETHRALLVFRHYLNVVLAPADLPARRPRATLPPLRRGIVLHDVWFRYDPGLDWVLRGVDLVIPAGSSLALVGLNGAGKSTLVKLLCRFYDPQRGRITWDGIDIATVEPAELRARIGAVFQDYMAYDLTAAENIGVGDLPSLSDRGRIREAAAIAGVDDALSRLRAGYDTMLSRMFAGEPDVDDAPGVTLSGGQWQRVALARGLMRSACDLVVLDEPSSGLDPDAEHEVHEALRTRRYGRTSILISHRLGAVRDADRIVVLSGGRVLETGTHADLIAVDGEYARLFARQSAGYRDESVEPLAIPPA
jgi:ATP-binding cassette, subfamily B, bacterial